MKDYIYDFVVSRGYAEPTINFIREACERIFSDKKSDRAFGNITRTYEKGGNFYRIKRKIMAFSQRFSLDEYGSYLLFFIAFTKELKRRYEEKSIPAETFERTVADLKYKDEECRLVKGRSGIFVPDWFQWHFGLKLFGFEILQFQLSKTDRKIETEEKIVKKGERALFVHIPRSGKRLDHETVLNDYRAAKDFFKRYFNLEIEVFCCYSWLLFPKNFEFLRPDSNIAKFAADYRIVAVDEYADYSEIWRLFDTEYRGNIAELPADTSLRRGYINLMRNGIKIGDAKGFLIISGATRR